jgi:peptidoglycan/LPS O-acetylase OafA/YrhL
MIGIYTYHNLDRFKNLEITNNRFWVIALLGMYVLMIAAESIFNEKFNIAFIIAAFCCVSMIVIFLKKNIHIKALQQIGQYSYTLYVVHFSVVSCLVWFLFSVVKLPPPYINNFFIWMPAVFICLGVSYLMYLLVELPAKKLLSRLRNK